jgi:hypothetical protein
VLFVIGMQSGDNGKGAHRGFGRTRPPACVAGPICAGAHRSWSAPAGVGREGAVAAGIRASRPTVLCLVWPPLHWPVCRLEGRRRHGPDDPRGGGPDGSRCGVPGIATRRSGRCSGGQAFSRRGPSWIRQVRESLRQVREGPYSPDQPYSLDQWFAEVSSGVGSATVDSTSTDWWHILIVATLVCLRYIDHIKVALSCCLCCNT